MCRRSTFGCGGLARSVSDGEREGGGTMLVESHGNRAVYARRVRGSTSAREVLKRRWEGSNPCRSRWAGIRPWARGRAVGALRAETWAPARASPWCVNGWMFVKDTTS